MEYLMALVEDVELSDSDEDEGPPVIDLNNCR